MNLEQARVNMVLQQVRSWEVNSARVLDALREIPREDFVLPKHRKLAFSDLRLPLGHGQVMMRPVEQGRLLQGLSLSESERVLEIGTGSGFLTACLARLAAHVISLELYPELADLARANLEANDVENIELVQGDVFEARYDAGQFDAVVVTGSAAAVPESMLGWLRPGGRLFFVRGYSPAMEAVVVRREESGNLFEQSLFETDLPRLVGAEDQPEFHL